MEITELLINKKDIDYLVKRWLEKQYIKAKEYILDWNFKNVDFKIREPKKDNIYYFRINKQYRALVKLENETLTVLKISNHQEK